MSFSITSINYIIMILIAMIAFYTFKQFQKELILIVNIVFYANFGKRSFFIILFMVIVTYLGGVFIRKKRDNKTLIFGCIVLTLIPLLLIKYCPGVEIIEPIGISFITFKAISFLIDIFSGEIEIISFKSYLGYITFFPTVISGPIDRYNVFKKRFDTIKCFDYERFICGLKILLYGYVMKMVLADRIAISVNNIWNNIAECGWKTLLFGVCMYSLQIYFDFAGYSYIALGVSKIFGIDCSINFRQPYLATSIGEFWDRWHISLSKWLRDYVYVPLGGNRKGFLRKNVNIIIVFLISGVWHGAGGTFVIWGLIHGAYQVIENIYSRYIGHKRNSMLHNTIINWIKRAWIFLIVTYAWAIFRSTSVNEWILLQQRIFFRKGGMPSSIAIGISMYEMMIIVGYSTICFIIDYYNSKHEKRTNGLLVYRVIVNALVIYVAIMSILVFGVYGNTYDASSFIYFNF